MREVRLWLKRIIQGRFELDQIATPSSLCRHQTATAPLFAVFQTLGDFSSPVTPGNTANLGRPLGQWASGPCIYTCGLLNSTHFFEVIGGDLLWMISWFYISAQSLEIVGTLGLILVAGTEGQKISLPQAILKAKQCSRAGKPLRAGIQSHKIREHRLSFKHDYIWLYHIIPSPWLNSTETVPSGVTLRRQETRPGGVWWRSGSWSLAVGGWFMPCQGGKQSELKGHEKVHPTHTKTM